MGSCTSQAFEFAFDQEVIAQTSVENRLLTMEAEFSRRCNFKCPYCYVPDANELDGELTVTEIRDVLMQTRALGGRAEHLSAN